MNINVGIRIRMNISNRINTSANINTSIRIIINIDTKMFVLHNIHMFRQHRHICVLFKPARCSAYGYWY